MISYCYLFFFFIIIILRNTFARILVSINFYSDNNIFFFGKKLFCPTDDSIEILHTRGDKYKRR